MPKNAKIRPSVFKRNASIRITPFWCIYFHIYPLSSINFYLVSILITIIKTIYPRSDFSNTTQCNSFYLVLRSVYTFINTIINSKLITCSGFPTKPAIVVVISFKKASSNVDASRFVLIFNIGILK